MERSAQLQIDFTKPIERPVSRSPINNKKFNQKNQDLLNHLIEGKTINHQQAQDLYGIRHLHSRIAEVRKVINIEDKYINLNGSTCKEYWIEKVC